MVQLRKTLRVTRPVSFAGKTMVSSECSTSRNLNMAVDEVEQGPNIWRIEVRFGTSWTAGMGCL